MAKKKQLQIPRLFNNIPFKSLFFIMLGTALGLMIGNLSWQRYDHDPRYTLASSSNLKEDKTAITASFKEESSTKCSDGTDPIPPTDRKKVFDEYLKINKYGNRAVIRGCNDIDTLLSKDPITGKWQTTNINISLDQRANPSWQVECLIDDITQADYVIRPENSSIDIYNLVNCRQLKEREQVAKILRAELEPRGIKLDDKIIDAYIKDGENF